MRKLGFWNVPPQDHRWKFTWRASARLQHPLAAAQSSAGRRMLPVPIRRDETLRSSNPTSLRFLDAPPNIYLAYRNASHTGGPRLANIRSIPDDSSQRARNVVWLALRLQLITDNLTLGVL